MLTITHDIKAPVGSILGYTDLLERITTEERQRFYLNNMQSSANHLLSLVKSLLDYHRLDAHKMDINRVSFNPHQLFDTIYISFKPMADSKQLEIELSLQRIIKPRIHRRPVPYPPDSRESAIQCTEIHQRRKHHSASSVGKRPTAFQYQ